MLFLQDCSLSSEFLYSFFDSSYLMVYIQYSPSLRLMF